jgi:hypothetical protein
VQGLGADGWCKILNPMQERRQKYEDNPRLAWDILEAGSAAPAMWRALPWTKSASAMNMSLGYEPPKDSAK